MKVKFYGTDWSNPLLGVFSTRVRGVRGKKRWSDQDIRMLRRKGMEGAASPIFDGFCVCFVLSGWFFERKASCVHVLPKSELRRTCSFGAELELFTSPVIEK